MFKTFTLKAYKNLHRSALATLPISSHLTLNYSHCSLLSALQMYLVPAPPIPIARSASWSRLISLSRL